MDYSNVIKSVGYDQHEILYNIMKLHNGGVPYDCDMTYSIGNFYGKFNIVGSDGNKREIEIPSPRIKFDVYPQMDDVVKIEPSGPLPLDDCSIDSIVCDLPFVISCGPSLKTLKYDDDGNVVKNNIIQRRFSAYYPVSQLLESYKHWIEEMYRVLGDGGLMVFKTQAVISGSKFLHTPYYSRLVAESCGFDSIDEFILVAKNRLISGKVKNQQHARSFHSYFLVFRKSLSKKISYFDHMGEDEIGSMLSGLRYYNLSRTRRMEEDMMGKN
ncbi:MAG: hypothetical protein J6Y37_12005 [Paludibacteraceae bacterium]|nr:hypothetical protein [Paludibacteraceae bacterium]